MNTIQFLAEWALRSSVLIVAGALVPMALRVKDSSIRLAAWVALLCGSVALPLMTVTLPAVPVTVVRPVAESVVFFESVPVAAVGAPQASVEPHASFDWARAGLDLYVVIALALILRIVIGLVMSRRLLRGSRATGEPGIRESEQVRAPVTLGIFRPAIVLPGGWREWDGAKLTAVLAHERSHIGRLDPAVQLLSAVHRAALWFSPASWFLHSRIVRAGEEASDDAAVTVTRDRASYAKLLLDFMSRQECRAGVPMARYGAAEKRIYRILDGKSLSRGLTRWSVAAIVMLGAPLAYLAASVRSEQLPARAIAVVRESLPATPPLVAQVIAQVKAPPAKPPATPVEQPATPVEQPATPVEQPAAAERPKFQVASIRPCDPNYVPPGGRGGPGATDRFRRNCVTIRSLISDAYIRFADGEGGRSPMMTILTKVEGGPAWINSDQYTIEAEADAPVTLPVMAGPMTQTLLEERFQLKVHRETREGPAYELTLAKGGAAKTLAAKGTPCVAADFADLPFPFRAGDDRPCNMIFNARKGPNMVMTARGLSMEQLTQSLTGATGRLVMDKTGITGNVDLNLVYAPEVDAAPARVVASADAAPVAEDPVGPSIFTALERVGLKLEPAKGSREYLVIDSVSRPSEN
jgi:uncharacterized protein (TIGR03435 family)